MRKNIKQKNIENSEINVSRSTSNGMINKQIKNNKGFTPTPNFTKKGNLVWGFTLVETMFAVLILTFTIVGLMSVVADSLFQARYAKDEITVNYLLQEAVDYIRNDRDTTVFLKNGGTWNNFVNNYINCSPSSGGCTIDVLADTEAGIVEPQQCLTSCPYLRYDKDATNDSFYNYDTNYGVETNFKRKIIVTPSASNSDEIDVTVTIDWKNGGLSATRSLTTSLLRWQQ